MILATKNQKTTAAKEPWTVLLVTGRATAERQCTLIYPRFWHCHAFNVDLQIIPHIFGPVFTVTIFSVIVAYAGSQGKGIELSNSIIPLLSVVVGLVLVFRNGTSYDRYWEGRKCFSTLTSNVRNLSRMVWVHVALPPTENGVANTQARISNPQLTHAELKRQKIEVLRYCLGFVFAVKHYLRGEDGTDYGDLTGVLPPHFSFHDGLGYTTSHKYSSVPSCAVMQGSVSDASISDRRSVDATKRVRRKRSKKNIGPQPNTHTPGCTTPLLGDSHQTVEFHPYADYISMPLPLIIAHEISSAIFRFRREGLLETVGPAGMNAMGGLVQSMVDQMTGMERIANSPIPSSYGIHLKQCVTLYLFALPVTLFNDLGWWTIPIVTVVAFTLMGIEGIADAIEMPFGYDPHDLPLDTYCDDLKEEVE
ncbi:Bestrophin, RFP-TM, chloride channel-domain-containing protein [Boletus reticuloceps]|uniref:Bestrophin, RFP-TM, chloride channel-domain-containing protein n=1 Tax=Boletus reticuloceps TaxID=495285 RepID=A0A8I2YRH7_9AGAM|nr:Bestrophin, RFP-TM, chloride channel-domain-containing protein [Boletus reticuloceps]